LFRPRSETEIEGAHARYRLPKNYILFCGTLEPRKNVVTLLDAYAELPRSIQEQYGLVLVGGKGWLDQEFRNKLSELQSKNILLTGYVPDEDLPAIYSGAAVFAYPSLYEGFGMPPLEAMACGVPVIVGDNS